MTDAEIRADLIDRGALRPMAVRLSSAAVFATDHAGRREAARDILLEEGRSVAHTVVDNPYADPAVRDMLRRWLSRPEAA